MSGDDVKALHDKIDALALTVNTINTKFDGLCATVTRHDTDLNGNGKTGLKAVVADHITREDERNRLWRLFSTGLGTVATILGIIGITKN